MLIAQVTDLHLGTDDDLAAVENYARLGAVLDRLARLRKQPDAWVFTGDLSETGSVESYRLLKRVLGRAGVESPHLCLGNHDVAENFRKVFGRMMFHDGFCQYARDLGEVTLIVTDTHDESQHGGDFCERRAEWLDQTLSARADKPAIVALHHPPFATGIDWMGARRTDEPWVVLLTGVLAKHAHVVKVIGGHIHRPIDRPLGNTSCVVSAATAAQVDLELAPVRASIADHRPLIINEPPAFCLHQWDGEALISHHGVAGEFNIDLRYDERFKPIMRDVFRVPD